MPVVTGGDINYNNVYGSGTIAIGMRILQRTGEKPNQTNNLGFNNDGDVLNKGNTGNNGGGRYIPANLYVNLSNSSNTMSVAIKY